MGSNSTHCAQVQAHCVRFILEIEIIKIKIIKQWKKLDHINFHTCFEKDQQPVAYCVGSTESM